MELNVLIKNLYNKVINLTKRGYISKSLKDNNQMPLVQVTYQGKTTTMILVNPYGFYSRPPVESLGLCVNVRGKEKAQDFFHYWNKNRYKDLEEGEVKLGNSEKGTYIFFKDNGDIEIKCENATIDAAKIDLGVGGNEIARKGDTVLVDGKTGTITGGGTNTSI